MIKLSNRPFWQTPMAPALLTLLIAIVSRFSTGFGMLLIVIMAVSTLLVMTCSLIALSHFARFAGARLENGISIALIVASIVSLGTSGAIIDQSRFMFWSARHRRVLQQATRKDGLVPQWSASGGADGAAVLVVDTRDALATPAGAEDWRQRTGWPCPIASARRMSSRVYMVTSDRCTPNRS
jgi:hypothetical protein